MRKFFILFTASIVCFACGSKPSEGETVVDERPATLVYRHMYIDGLFYNLYDNYTAEVTFENPNGSEFNYSWFETEVEIPLTVTYNDFTYDITRIGDYAFRGCDAIKTVNIPDCIESIGIEAFAYCDNLSYVSFPNSIKSVDHSPFVGSNNLICPIYNDYVFAYMPASSVGTYIIPDGIEFIGGGAFSGCEQLTAIVIPNSVTYIGNAAFYFCKNLRSLNLPNSVYNTGDKICWGCTSLMTPIYNDHVFAFLPYSWEGEYAIQYGIEQIASSAFWGCTNLTYVAIPNTITRIGDRAFVDCKNLYAVNIPVSVSVIEDYAFLGCENLTSVTFPHTEIQLGEDIFSGCYNVQISYEDY